MNSTSPTLFDYADTHAKARRTDPLTSHEAAESINVQKDEALVIEALTRFGPMTTIELAAKTGRKREAISPRLRPLERKGLVVVSSERRNGSIVWSVK